MLNLPLFHSGGVMPTTAMLIHGGAIVMVDAFDTDVLEDGARSPGSRPSILLGVMGGFLLKRPPSSDDKTIRCAPAPMCRSTTLRRNFTPASAPESTPIST